MSEDTTVEKELGPLKPGDRFGDCTVERLLGQGSMASVFLVRASDGAQYALKVMDPGLAKKDPTYRERFLREAEFAMKIRHRNLISVHDAGEESERGFCYILMDYMPGGTVKDLVRKKGALPVAQAIQIATQLAVAMEVAHIHGIIHRDIKPDNIMFDADGVPKLADLGVARFAADAHLNTQKGMIVGTPAYISPEQAIDSSTVDTRADIYSLGVILFELLCGRRPYTGDTTQEVLLQLLDPSPIPDVRTFNDKISPELSDVLLRMCAKKREDRLASPKVLIETFRRLGYGIPSSNEAEFAPEEDVSSEGMVQDLIPDPEKASSDGDGLTLETQDEEVQEFLANLRRTRMCKRLVLWGVVSCLIVLLAALLWRFVM